MADVEVFFGLLLVTPLEQWDVEKWDRAHVTFTYLNIIFANFQPKPYSYLASYCIHIHINVYINTTSSISITNTKLLPYAYSLARPTLVGCGHKILLRKDMSYGWTCFFWSTCFSG